MIGFDQEISDATDKKRKAELIDFDRLIAEALCLKLYDRPNLCLISDWRKIQRLKASNAYDWMV